MGKKILVVVKPNSKETKVVEQNEASNRYVIAVKAPTHENKANMVLLKFVSRMLKKRVKIASGFKSREKIIEILE